MSIIFHRFFGLLFLWSLALSGAAQLTIGGDSLTDALNLMPDDSVKLAAVLRASHDLAETDQAAATQLAYFAFTVMERIEWKRRMVEKERSAQRRVRATIGGALVLLALAVLFIRLDRSRRRHLFEKDAARLETQALRAQMNPHFIFNALNSISAFVQKNEPDKAVGYLGKFARLMRLVLENSRQSEVPLKDDLEALDVYLHLERTRGGDKFDYAITVDPTIDQENTLVPPLVIQPFVENAIWHGMAGKEGKGHITLSVTRRADELIMTIEDDGVGRHAPKVVLEGVVQKKSSLATTITQARLDLVQKQKGRPAGFKYIDIEQGTRVEVSLPISEAA